MEKRWWIWGIVVAFALTLLSPLASPWPDGLERVAENLGFIEKARELAKAVVDKDPTLDLPEHRALKEALRAPLFQIIPDYVFPGVGHEALATILAGIVGTAITLALGYGLARLMKQKA